MQIFNFFFFFLTIFTKANKQKNTLKNQKLIQRDELLLFCWKEIESRVTQVVLSTRNTQKRNSSVKMQIIIAPNIAGKIK